MPRKRKQDEPPKFNRIMLTGKITSMSNQEVADGLRNLASDYEKGAASTPVPNPVWVVASVLCQEAALRLDSGAQEA